MGDNFAALLRTITLMGIFFFEWMNERFLYPRYFIKPSFCLLFKTISIYNADIWLKVCLQLFPNPSIFFIIIITIVLSDKFLQVYRNYLSILADLNNVVFRMDSTCPLISTSSAYFINPLEIVPSVLFRQFIARNIHNAAFHPISVFYLLLFFCLCFCCFWCCWRQ